MTRHVYYLLALAFIVWMTFAVQRVNGEPMPPPDETAPAPSSPAPTTTTTVLVPVVDSVAQLKLASVQHRLTIEHRRLLVARRRVHTLTRTLAHSTSTREAIDLACSVYGNCGTLWSLATCESHLYRYARNPSGATGLLQFMPSTWATTPFARFSIFSPYAQALAGGWMLTHGRRGEWVC